MQKWLTRYTAFYIIIGLTALFLLLSLFRSASWLWLAIPGLALCIQGLVDITQTRHAIRRNYPVIGNLRFIFEAIRPEIRQYFLGK